MFQDLAVYGQTLIAAMSPGAIATSRNGGSTWEPWSQGLLSDWIFAGLAIRPPYVWALRGGFGNAYRRPLSEITTGVQEAGTSEPPMYQLFANYPNPFNPLTTIRYGLPERSHVNLVVYNALGQQVAHLVNGEVDAGYHEVKFDASSHPSGIYFYRLQTGSYVETRKLCLVR